jgi:hypothetical protein
MVTIPLAPVDVVRLTILMDNLTDPLRFPTQQVERITWLHHLAKPRIASALAEDGLPDASALGRVTTGSPPPLTIPDVSGDNASTEVS